MPPIYIEGETGWLTSLERVKDYLRDTGTENDPWYEQMIGAVTDAVQSYCDRLFAEAAYSEKYDGNGKDQLRLKQYPISAVTSLAIDDDAVDLTDADEYQLYADEGIICLPYGIFSKGRRNVEVAYTAGYSTIPEDLEQAVIEWIALKWHERQENRIGITNKGGNVAGSLSFAQDDIPPEVRKILDLYRRLD
jgi:hypothetical protein